MQDPSNGIVLQVFGGQTKILNIEVDSASIHNRTEIFWIHTLFVQNRIVGNIWVFYLPIFRSRQALQIGLGILGKLKFWILKDRIFLNPRSLCVPQNIREHLGCFPSKLEAFKALQIGIGILEKVRFWMPKALMGQKFSESTLSLSTPNIREHSGFFPSIFRGIQGIVLFENLKFQCLN